MEKLPLKRTLALLLFLSPVIANGQYQARIRPDGGPVRVNQPGAIPYHDYAMPVPNNNNNINLQGFSSRKGPFDTIMERAKSWLPGSNGEVSSEPKMRDAHRLPNPPKYPLYDLPSIGMATPPPAPLMHPMAQIPTGNYNYNEQVGSASTGSGSWSSPSDLAVSASNIANNRGPGHHNHAGPHHHHHNRKKPLGRLRPKPHPPRGPHPFRPGNKKRIHNHNHLGGGGPPPNRRQHHQRQRPRGPPVQNRPNRLRAPPQKEEGFEHPMASNISPVNSPALGRPLDYDEYMKRPSHSFTDDPWNFDPFAAQMNQGMNTYALKYNYDPLGMNNLDSKANSHLDPAKLSYPGDFYNREASEGAGSSQIGGWDRPSGGYNGYMNPNLPSAPYDTSLTNPTDGGRIGDPFSSGSDPINSFNLFQESNRNANNDNGQIGPTATVDLESLSPPSDDGKIEFTIDTSVDPNGNNNNNNNDKGENFAGLSDTYSPYGPPELGPPFGSAADSNSDALQPPSYNSYARTSDYGMRNRRANYYCQFGDVQCVRQLKRNLVIPTHSPNMLYSPSVNSLQDNGQHLGSMMRSGHAYDHIGQQQQFQQLQQQQQQQQLFHQQQPIQQPIQQQRQLYQQNPYRRQMTLSPRQMNYIRKLQNANGMPVVMEVQGSQQPNLPEGLQIFSDLMKPNGHNNNLLSHSAKADARNNLLKVLTQ